MEEMILWCTRITAAAAATGVLWKVYRRFAEVVGGIRCILRSEMLRVYYHNREAEQIRQYEAENFEHNDKAYVALGGNSFIGKVYNEVSRWEVVS
jgi:hypothetical protein